MKAKYRKLISIFSLFFVLFLTILPNFSQAASSTLADGEYSISFTFLKDGTEDASVMDGFTEKPAKLFVDNGDKTVEMTLTGASMIQYLKLGTDESGIDVEIVENDTANDRRVVRFPVDDLLEKMEFYTHVIVPGIYDSKYRVQLKFDLDSLIEVNVPTEPTTPTEPEEPTESTFIQLTVLKNGTEETSSMGRYVENPVKYLIINGKNIIELTLTDSDMITKFQVEKNGEYVDTEIIKEDTDNNKRTVRFEVESLSGKTNAKVTVDTKSQFGEMTHTVQLKFGEDEPTNPTEPEEPNLADGNYTIDFTALHATKDEASGTDKRFSKPATLTIENGKKFVSFSTEDSSTIVSLQVEKDGQFVEVETVSEDVEKDTREIKFEVDKLAKVLNAKVTVYVQEIDFRSEQNFRIKFDLDSIQRVEQSTPVLENGEYTINFRAMHATKDEESAGMKSYLLNPAKLVVENSKNQVYLTVQEKEGTFLTDIRLEKNGEFVSQEIVSEDQESLQRVIKFEVTELGIINAEVDMHVVAANYKNTQKFRLAFDLNSVQPVEKNPEEPTNPNPTNPTNPTNPSIGNGTYTIGFTFLKDGTESASTMDSFTEKPAKLIVENGNKYIEMTLTNASMIQFLKLGTNETGTNVTTVSTDVANDKKVVRFPVQNLTNKIEFYTHVIVPAMPGFPGYDSKYRVQLKLDESSLKKVNSPTVPSEPTETREITLVPDQNGVATANLANIVKPTLLKTNYKGVPIEMIVPAGSNSLTIKKLEQGDKHLLVEIIVGNLGDRTVTLTLPKPTGLTANQVGAFHQNGDTWEYRGASAHGDKVTFETNLSVVKIAEKVAVPANLTASVSENKATISWDPVTGADYELVQILDGKETIIPVQATSYTDTLTENRMYSYKVRAIKNHHQSAWSNNVFASTGNHSGEIPLDKREDGEYTIEFRVLKDGTNQTSIMQEYTGTKAKLTIENGKYYVSITLVNSSWAPVFQVVENGGPATVVSSDTAADTRVVQFEVYDLTEKVVVYTEAVVPEIDYSGEYYVQIEFDPDSITSGYSPSPIIPKPMLPTTEKVITISEGATVEFDGVVITFPKDSFSSDFKLTVEKLANVLNLPFKETEKLVSSVFEIEKDKDGNFSKAITIVIPYDKSKVDLEKQELGIFWLNEKTKEWVKLDNIKVDLKAGTVSGQVDHFTKFAVLAIDKTEEIKPVLESKPVVEENKPTTSNFKDVQGHWAEEQINQLVEQGAVTGYEDGFFRPNNEITRAEFTKILVKALGLDVKSGKVFADTANHWAEDEIATAVSAGIVVGYNHSKFGPNDLLTREQMATMIARAKKLKAGQTSLALVDENSIAPWAKHSVKVAVQNGIITGYPDNTFKPKGAATRAEAVAVIVRALEIN